MIFEVKVGICILVMLAYFALSWYLEVGKKNRTADDEAMASFMIFPGLLFVFAICALILEIK